MSSVCVPLSQQKSSHVLVVFIADRAVGGKNTLQPCLLPGTAVALYSAAENKLTNLHLGPLNVLKYLLL